MKYVYWTALTVALACVGLIGYRLAGRSPPETDPAVIINDRVVSRDELQQRLKASGYKPSDVRVFVDRLITQELLIQEAHRLGIDREEPFRLSLQNFYEQSLVKTLLDRKYRTTEISVGEAERRRYRVLAARTIRFTIGPAPGSPSQALPSRAETRTVGFEELSSALRLQVTRLNEGETSAPFRLGDDLVVLRLDSVGEPPAPPSGEDHPSAVDEILTEDKREQAVNEWLWQLREAASVEVRVPGDG